MKIRRPLGEPKPKVKFPKKKKNGVALVDSSEIRNLLPSQDLPDLEKYNEKFPSWRKESWFKKAKPYLRAFIAEGLSR